MSDSFIIFKLNELATRLEPQDARIVREAIDELRDKDREIATSDELWRSLTIRAAEPSQ